MDHHRTDPTQDVQETSADEGVEGTGGTDGPGNVSVDEPTDPALNEEETEWEKAAQD